MEKFLKRWLNELRSTPPRSPEKRLLIDFPGAAGLEWHPHESGFEGRFILDGHEMIAVYTRKGKLKEYRKNLPREPLPEVVKNLKGQWGEVMSLISINKPGSIQFEVIFRKQDHSRYLMIIDDKGEVITSPRKISPENYPNLEISDSM